MAKRRNFEDDRSSVEHLVKKVERLTTWEADFIDSMHDRLQAGRPLTTAQGDTLDEVWENVVARPLRERGLC